MSDPNDPIADLLQQFHKETFVISSFSECMRFPSAIALVAEGEPVVEYVFRHNVELDVHLMTVLQRITQQNPVSPEHAGNMQKMQEDWKNWASQNNYL